MTSRGHRIDHVGIHPDPDPDEGSIGKCGWPLTLTGQARDVKVNSMRPAIDCPFNVQPDIVPPIWAGRHDEINDWLDRVRPRLVDGLSERPRVILGEAGLGKSTLVRKITDEARGKGDLVTGQLRIPLGGDPLSILGTALLELAKDLDFGKADKAIDDLFSRVSAFSLKGLSVSMREKEAPEAYRALKELLIRIGRAAIVRGNTVIVIHLDEVQNITDETVLSQLLIVLGDVMAQKIGVTTGTNLAIERYLPIAVYLTGLPDFWDMASARRGATFGRRSGRTVLAPLSDQDLEVALQGFVIDGWPATDGKGGQKLYGMEPEARDAILDLCQGEPYLFQVAGYHAWYAGDSETITREDVLRGWGTAKRDALEHVERILERLPEKEGLMIQAMAALTPEERTLKNIATEMGYESSPQVGMFAKRLDATRGLINRSPRLYTFRHRAIEAHLTRDWPEIPEDS